MNIVDYACIAVLAISVLFGAYSGLITTTLNAAGFFFSWFLTTRLHHTVAQWILGNDTIMQTVSIYTEGAAHIPSHEVAQTVAAALPPEQLQPIIDAVSAPTPFNNLLRENIAGQVFQSSGLTTVAQYYDQTLFAATVNILSFLITLVAIYFVLTMVITLVQYVVKFPVLRMFDSVAGCLVGLFRGVYVLYAIYMLTPILLSVLPAELTGDILRQSALSAIFYPDNPMLSAIRGFL